MSVVTAQHEVSILERLVIDPDCAQALISMRFAPADEERMRELMDRNNQGILTAEEQAEMEAFRRVGSFLAVAQAKARLQLKQANGDDSHGA